ncbi:MAG: autotransporter outer membrane beta-barrel domain-containing protein [Enterobacteriaceae bacterium]
MGVTATIAGQHTFYVDLDSSTGGEFNQRQANMGYRFSF